LKNAADACFLGRVSVFVSIRRCESYDRRLLVEALRRCLDDIGGLPATMRRGQSVYLKPNLLSDKSPETAVTTHPDFVYAAAKILVEAGFRVTIGDSPAAGLAFSEGFLRRAYATVGFDRAARDAGAELNYDVDMTMVTFGERSRVRQMPICTPAVEADHIVNLPKGKTHVYVGMTAAVKNLYGLVHGKKKAGYHAALPSREAFARMLVDLCERFRPAISMLDAVVCMEGEGPGAGDPRKVGAVVVSTDPHRLDEAFFRIVGVDPSRVPTIVEAEKQGLLREECRLVGDSPTSFGVKGFRLPASTPPPFGLQAPRVPPRLLRPLLRRAFLLRPRVQKPLCTGCGRCAKGCPVDAIEIVNEKSVIDDSKCIRCYCCHEVCPERAIRLERSLLFRLVSRIT
jgi:uncharacterized protein (DUF362 family)/Pyruvate/2-oxoacid:ferredoxin oxidoreductase delta subunit